MDTTFMLEFTGSDRQISYVGSTPHMYAIQEKKGYYDKGTLKYISANIHI